MFSSKSLFGFLLSGLLLSWLAYTLDWSALSDHLRALSLVPFLVALFFLWVHYVLRALRWQVFLPAPDKQQPKATIRVLFDGLGISNFCNYLLPMRAGEVVRAWFVATQSAHTTPEVFSTVVIERLFDLTVVLLSFAALALWGTEFDPLIILGARTFTLGAFLLAAALAFGTFFSDLTQRLLRLVVEPLPLLTETHRAKLYDFVAELLKATKPLRRIGTFSAATGLSIAVWLSNYICIYFFLVALQVPANGLIAITTGVVLALAVAAPAAPGFLGSYQWGCIAGLAMFGISKEHATAFSVVSHATQYILYLGYGTYILYRYNISTQRVLTISNAGDALGAE